MTNRFGLRKFYFREDRFVEHWAPRIGMEAARYKWRASLLVAQAAPAMAVWFLCIFVGARRHVPALTVLGVFVLVGSSTSWVVGTVFDRRATRAARAHDQSSKTG